MREIKFRGEKLGTGEWVHGDLVTWWRGEGSRAICDIGGIKHDVDPATVGQFSGLLDKNGVEIWENDEVLATLKYFNIKNQRCKIIFHDGSFGVQHGFSTDYFKTISAWDEIEVIHDTPTLAQGGDER